MDKQQKKLLRQIPLKVLLIGALFLLALFIFAYIAHEAVYEHEAVFDTRVHAYLLAHSTPSLVEVAQWFTVLGSSFFLFPVYIVLLVILLIRRQRRDAIDIAIVALSSFLLMQALKQIFHRKRPDLPIIKDIHNYSFPSGHSLSSFIFCSILSYLIWKGNVSVIWKWLLTVLLLLLAVAVGLSRIVLNVHFATDVIAGFCLGVMWVIVSFWMLQRINKRRSIPKQ